MSDFQQQAQGDVAPWAKHNENFDALAGVGLYAERKAAHSGLNFGYMGGVFRATTKAAGTIALTNNATNYIVADLTTGNLSASTTTTNWNNENAYARICTVVTSGGNIGAVVDYRGDEFGLIPMMAAGVAGPGGSSTSLPVVTVSGAGASYLLDVNDSGSMMRFTGTGSKSVLVEPVSGLVSGVIFHFCNRGASGNVTIVVDSNMVVNNPKDGSRVLEPGDTVSLHFVSATEADLYGSTQ